MATGTTVLLLASCNSYVGPAGTTFVAAPGFAKPRQVAERAVTVRGTDSVLAAGGAYLGVVTSDGLGSDVTVVRQAAWQAALIGGTHILLRDAHVDRIDTSVAVRHNVMRGSVQQTAVGYQPIQTTEIHAVFDVFRVEPAAWARLHPQMRPPPVSR